MGMENLLNYYFIMKKRFVTVLLACSLAGGLFAQQPWFKDKDLTLTGAYYYPEHWDESQWERDFKQMHDLGFDSPISRNLLGRNWNRKRENMILPGWIKRWLWLPNMI